MFLFLFSHFGIIGAYYVQIFYQDGVDAERKELHIPNCAKPCPLNVVLEKTNSTAVWSLREFESLCIKDDKPSHIPVVSTEIILILAICLSCVGLVSWRRKEGKSNLALNGGGEKFD